ncbi:MAG TPA: TfoX/Sxy family protein [Fimbriiglobus sp.]|jgi:DNA transformation protein
MRKKSGGGNKTPTDKQAFINLVKGRFASVEGFRTRAMFGGYGLYLGDSFFAIVDESRIYFRVTADTKSDYESAGMTPFEPWPGHVMTGYYEVPPGVWNDDVLLREWARRAAMRSTKSKTRPTPKKSKEKRR